MVKQNEQMMKFVNALFPQGFSNTEEEYAVVFFNNNMGKGSKKIKLSTSMHNEIIDQTKTLGANEVILIHSQPEGDFTLYPTQEDVELFNTIESQLTLNNIEIFNNVLISKQSGAWQAITFKDVEQPGNFK